jgi:sigma-B regulation protein RsbQ
MSLLAEQSGAVRRRNNVTELGNPNGRPIVFAHGFGCSQAVWRHVTPAFLDDYRVIVFDAVGAGASDLAAYDRGKYDSLHGYADDVLDIVRELDLRDVVYVGHSVASMVGVLAANSDPSRFGALVLVSPSPRYINDEGYYGGFEDADIRSLLDELDSNYLGWSSAIAPLMMGNTDRPQLGEELTGSFCSTDPSIARHFAHVTFLSDNRADLAQVSIPTLVLQAQEDVIAPLPVGTFVHEQIAGSTLVVMETTGHCANLSGPREVTGEIMQFLG